MTPFDEQGANVNEPEHESGLDDGQVIMLMRQAAHDIDRPTKHLVREAVRRGRRRRRLVRTAETASACAIVGAVIVIVVSTFASGHAADRSAASKGPTASTTAPSYQRSTASTRIDKSHVVPLTPNVIIARALKAVPIDGTVTHYANKSTRVSVGASFSFHNGSDASEITIIIRRNDPAITRCQQKAVSCRQLPDGTTFAQQIIGSVGHPTAITVTSYRSDGTDIEVSETHVTARRLVNVPNGRKLWVDESHITVWANASQWTAPVTQQEAATARRGYPITGS